MWFWCLLRNNYNNPVKVVVTSWLGQGTYYLYPNQQQWVQWYPGLKVLAAWDQYSQQLVALYPFQVTGPGLYNVISGNMPAPVGGLPAPNPPAGGGGGGNGGGGGGNFAAGGGAGGGANEGPHT